MRKTLVFGWIAWAIFASAHSVQAAQHEVSGASLSGITIASGTSQFSLLASYAYSLDSAFQLGGTIQAQTSPSDLFVLLVGPAYNFGAPSLKDSFYVSGKVGVASDNGADFVLEAKFGKRFGITESVSYNPFMRFLLVGSATSFQIGLFSLSVLF